MSRAAHLGKPVILFTLLAALMGQTGPCNLFPPPPAPPDNGDNGSTEVESKAYRNSVGFWIPEGHNRGAAADDLRAEIADLAISAFVRFGLKVSSPWLIVVDVVQAIPSVGAAAPSYDYYVKTDVEPPE